CSCAPVTEARTTRTGLAHRGRLPVACLNMSIVSLTVRSGSAAASCRHCRDRCERRRLRAGAFDAALARGAGGPRRCGGAGPRAPRSAQHGELVVRLWQRDAGSVRAADRDGNLSRAGLRAVCRRRLSEPALPELPGPLRLVLARHALLGIERDG